MERGVVLDKQSVKLWANLQKPKLGGFVEIKSLHGPLLRLFTPDEAKYGICSECDIWKPERDVQGKVIKHVTMRVFTISYYDSDFGKYNYKKVGFPDKCTIIILDIAIVLFLC